MILNRVAETALARIESGRPAFRRLLPAHGGGFARKLAEQRRDALAELYRLRLIRRGPKGYGPEITQTGRQLLAKLRAYRALRKRERSTEAVFGVEREGLLARYNISVDVADKRAGRSAPLKFD